MQRTSLANAKSRPKKPLWRVGAMALAIVAPAALPGPGALAQQEPIKFIVPFPAGGAADVIARVLSEHVSKAHGRALIVENRPGANGVIGTVAAARAAPDGGTIVSQGPGLILDAYLRKVEYDPFERR